MMEKQDTWRSRLKESIVIGNVEPNIWQPSICPTCGKELGRCAAEVAVDGLGWWGITCSGCGAKQSRHDYVWTCPYGVMPLHREGWVLCKRCRVRSAGF